MTDLTLDKIKNVLGAHNDGVFRLESRENLGEIVGWLVGQIGNAEGTISSLREQVKYAPTLQKLELSLMFSTDDVERQQTRDCIELIRSKIRNAAKP